ncbi:ubiquitin-like protein ATG12 [Hyalella azteca]|uniref:Ubiquitin-like protein ATG12 n=1 Tax=Hyalella azteca TaxID=294128 RepID=A0A8B7PPJ4_HYAAZ|nr:ubiquitin-like protein ATG12 [Hyalella azteca]
MSDGNTSSSHASSTSTVEISRAASQEASGDLSKPQDDPTSASAVDASSTQLIPSLAEQSSNQATVQVPDSVPDPVRCPVPDAASTPASDCSTSQTVDSAASTPGKLAHNKSTDEKIEIILKATGDAPIMKKTKWSVVRSRSVGWVATFIKKYSHLPDTDTLFLYVNQSYAPAPDELLDNLYSCFGADNKLVLHYSKTQAWG